MIYGWISPDGAIYDCEFMAHYDLACEFVEAYKYKTYFDNRSWPADEVLVRNGWIKCYTSMFDRNHIRLYCPKRLTDIQKKILRDDYFDHPENWDKCEKYLLEELEVIDPEYDESGCRV